MNADPHSLLAVTYLMHSDRFYAASVGYAGVTPPQVLAWQIVFRDPSAVQMFRMLSGDQKHNRRQAVWPGRTLPVGLCGVPRSCSTARTMGRSRQHNGGVHHFRPVRGRPRF